MAFERISSESRKNRTERISQQKEVNMHYEQEGNKTD